METGDLVWRSVKLHAAVVKQVSAFVPQDSAFPPSLTAAEVMRVHASLLGLGKGAWWCPGGGVCGKAAALDEAVTHALQGVGLARHADTLVGGPLPGGLLLRGLSGGERKRLAVACGLLGAPHLLLLDEPTTGLDATTAASLMRRLSWLCQQQGMTIMCSLHQPRAAIWSLLDVVVVLASGYCVYSGPREGLVAWLTQGLAYAYSPTQHGSPADWVLDLVNTSFTKPKEIFSRTMSCNEDLAAAAAAFTTNWEAAHPALLAGAQAPPGGNTPSDAAGTEHGAARDERGSITPLASAAYGAADGADDDGVPDGSGDGGKKEQAPSTELMQRQGASWLRQVCVLAWREGALVARNPADMAGRALVFCWAGLVAGAVFYATDNKISGMGQRGILLYAEVAVLFLLPFVYMSLYTADRRTFTAELAAGLYRPSAYYAAKGLLLVLFSSLNSAIFSAVAYGMAGLHPAAGTLFAHMLVATLGYLIAQQVLYCAAILCPNQDLAFMLAIVWTAVNILLANYPMRLVEYTMTWVQPLKYASAMYYAFSGLLAIEFRHAAPFSCAEGIGDRVVQQLPHYLPTISVLKNPVLLRMLAKPGPSCQLDPLSVLSYFSVDWPWWAYMLLLVGYLLLMHAASLGALMLVARREKR